ncbi:MAG: choice-of-anchor D domain-containing protein, partial [Chloroflexi bacterium]|nr:choice-of-anchor D domain-containing protein [Chloroflexota bacterium]
MALALLLLLGAFPPLGARAEANQPFYALAEEDYDLRRGNVSGDPDDSCVFLPAYVPDKVSEFITAVAVDPKVFFAIENAYNGFIKRIKQADPDGSNAMSILSGKMIALGMDQIDGPEIVVTGPQGPLDSGASIYMGHVDVDGGVAELQLMIYNVGYEDLILSGNPKVQISGTNADDFTVTQQPASPVAVGHTTIVNIQFDPVGAGNRRATLTIPNNDADEGNFTLSISGIAMAPMLSISKAVSDATADPGQPITYTITVSNEGGAPARDVLISDTLPSGIHFVGPVTWSDDETGIGAQTADDLPTLLSDLTLYIAHTVVVTVPVVVDESLPGGTLLTNVASMTCLACSVDPDASSQPVQVTVNHVAPAAQDDAASTDEDTPKTISVLSNDSDANGDTLSLQAVGTPTYGQAAIQGTQIVYTPTNRTANYTDVFTYTVSDGALNDTATVTISVTADN